MNITPKELDMLFSIAESEYNSSGDVTDDVWFDYIVTSQSLGGVVTSLQKKGLVEVKMIHIMDSDNRVAGISDSTIHLTDAGADAYRANKA
jgi:secreted Zn-dependent insulinase-like peptidase